MADLPAKPRIRIASGYRGLPTSMMATVTEGSPSPAYEAASTGPRATTWNAPNLGPHSSIAMSHGQLVRRSRDALRKNGYAESAVRSVESNVVGTGIKPRWNTPDPELNKALGELWLDWTDEADADGRLDFYGMQALAVRAMESDGEVFGRFRVRRPGDMDTVPFQVQMLETDFVPVDEDRPRRGREVRAGIEFDAVGNRTAYWMRRRHPNDPAPLSVIRDDGLLHAVPASEVAHLYEPRRPGSIRGEPWLSRALVKLRDVDLTDDATVIRQQIANMFAAFITRPDDQNPIMSEAQISGTQRAVAGLMPGTVQILAPGEEITFNSPPDLGMTYEPFMRQQLRHISVAARSMYELVTGDYSKVNDRTFRASVNEFRRQMEMIQNHLIVFLFCRPTVLRWVDLALMSGLITPPASMDLRALYRVKWIPQGWKYIHPEQEVRAHEREVANKFRSRSDVINERGDDPEVVDAEIARDKEREQELGIEDEPPAIDTGDDTGDAPSDERDDAPEDEGNNNVE